MKKLLFSLAASFLVLPIAAPAKAAWVLIDHQVIDQTTDDLDGLGFSCLYYQYQDTYLEDTSGETSDITYWISTGICDFTSMPEITPINLGL
jgi:hypothetical protein